MNLSQVKRWLTQPWTRRTIAVIAIAVVVGVLWRHIRAIEWAEVLRSIRGYDANTVMLAAAISALGYLAYSCYDLLGKHYLRLHVSPAQCMSTGFVAYAFNQSLGAMIGTVAFRFRLYSRLGVDAAQISKQIAFSVVTNWFGFAALAGMLFVSGYPQLPVAWDLGQTALRWLGAAALAIVTGYLLMCALRRRPFRLFNRALAPPNGKIALLQLACSTAHWSSAAAILYVLLGAQIEFQTVLGVLALSAVATVAMRIPAGLGILEAVFVALLQHRLRVSEILAALLVYRAVFNLLPLAVAALVYLKKEFFVGHAGAHRTATPSRPSPS